MISGLHSEEKRTQVMVEMVAIIHVEIKIEIEIKIACKVAMIVKMILGAAPQDALRGKSVLYLIASVW